MASGATGACSGNGDSWATKPTAAQEQAKRRPGALLPPASMEVLAGATQSSARSAVARRVGDVMRNVRAATSRPGQDGQSPPVTPSLPSLLSTPTRGQQPTAEGVARMLSGLDPEPAARAAGLDALAQKLTPAQLDEHASALLAKGDLNLLLNLGRLQLLVEPSDETNLDTVLALLERRCVSDDSPVRGLLEFLSCDCEEQEAIRRMLSSRLDRMLELLCGDHVSWPAGRCELGKLVACADPRYKKLSWSECVAVDDAMDSLLPVAPSQKHWRQARAVLSGMPEDMPAEEQAKRMHLAVFSPKKDIDVLTTFNEYRQGTIASMVSELADGIGAVALGDRLVRDVQDQDTPMPAPAAPAAGSSGTSAPQPPQSGMSSTAAAFARMSQSPRSNTISVQEAKRVADDGVTGHDYSGITFVVPRGHRPMSMSATPAAPAPTPAAPAAPVPAANAALRAAKEAREWRASQGVGAPPRSGHAAAPSGAGRVVTLADLPSSEQEEDRCAICGGIGVPGVKELVPCDFGDGCCIQEEGEAPRRACWHAACNPELRRGHGRRVVCARHETDARLKLDVGASSQQARF